MLRKLRAGRMNQARHRSKRNPVLRIWCTELVVRRVVREEWEHAKADLAEKCRSFMGNDLKEMMQQTSSMMNAVQKLLEKVPFAIDQPLHHGWANSKSPTSSRDRDFVDRIGDEMGKNYVRNLRLSIRTELPEVLFTERKLEREDRACISVALIDANTRDVVTSGPESSIKLDVVVLDGNFDKDDEDNWAQEEFEKCMVKAREKKGILLAGNLTVTLKKGVGTLGELTFKDISSKIGSGKFKIGLKVASGYCGTTRIREAISNAFCVKDRKGETNKKHPQPLPADEVWRLEKIAKDGKFHRKLSEAGVHTVEDFLQKLHAGEQNLREVLGNSMAPKSWKRLVDHAKTCPTWKKYIDYPNVTAGLNTDRQKTGLIEDTKNFAPRHSVQEKEPGDTTGKEAFDNWNAVGESNGEAFFGSMQKKSSSSFPSQDFEGQTVQYNVAIGICAAPVGPEALPANAGSTVEGHNGATALPFPAQSQNTNCGFPVAFSADGSAPLAAPHPINPGWYNISYSTGDNTNSAVGSSMQPGAMRSPMVCPLDLGPIRSPWDQGVLLDEPVFSDQPMGSPQWDSAHLDSGSDLWGNY